VAVKARRCASVLHRRARPWVGRNRAAGARGGPLADSDPFFRDLWRQRVGPHAVDTDLIVIVAERKQGRRAFGEPVATGPGLDFKA